MLLLLPFSGDIVLKGRIVLNLWRHLKNEVKTTKYTVHGLASEILGITFPYYPRFTLACWWYATAPESPNGAASQVAGSLKGGSSVASKKDLKGSYSYRPLRFRCLNYLLRYLELSLCIFDSVDLLSRSEELARLFGTDIWSVMSRGSQHRVEAMVCRAAHALGYLMFTASKVQVSFG